MGAFVLVSGIIAIVLHRVTSVGYRDLREEYRRRWAQEDAARARQQELLRKLLAAAPARVERRPMGFVLHEGDGTKRPRGDGRSVVVIYEPAPSDDAAGVVRER